MGELFLVWELLREYLGEATPNHSELGTQVAQPDMQKVKPQSGQWERGHLSYLLGRYPTLRHEWAAGDPSPLGTVWVG